ncbi:MAG: tRNA (N6-isopentenyl adenosine(37)-C2)-methylthiotransferase MiaB [Anaerovoracaceae bacterium]|nr:tRNA (N6-isopentenyl adenosine(37)-C2)-methylthiotransferase MiaB [Anaerovoracaceae bacterium]
MKEDKTFNIRTMGCQMNERDSETLAGMLTELGYVHVDDPKKADVAIINTCSVRDNADKRFFGTLGQLKKVKEQRPGFIVCVCGCMMQQQTVIDELKAKYPWVDIVFGTYNIHEFPALLQKVSLEKEKIIDVWDSPGGIIEGLPHERRYSFKAFVNIMYGCNNFCTYCIVPYTRGRERSRRPQDIIAEARRLAADGVKEITLLGQNVNSYDGGECDFAGLLYMLNGVPGIERIRFMTSHPKDLSERLIQAYRDCGKLCHNIHLPVQSGSNAVLRRMNRHYDREKYLGIVRKLRDAVPDITISTDIIVGFPGETERDFQDTLDLVNEVKYDSAFTFLYSKRPGTPAAEYEDQIEESVKHERFGRLVDAVNTHAAEKNAAMIGRRERILVEGPSRHNKETLTGRTDGFKVVDFAGPDTLIGGFCDVEITEGKTFSLKGKLL